MTESTRCPHRKTRQCPRQSPRATLTKPNETRGSHPSLSSGSRKQRGFGGLSGGKGRERLPRWPGWGVGRAA